jgi:hypothetical protein
MAVLQLRVEEFKQQGHPLRAATRVIPQDGGDGADTGVVAVHVMDSPTEIYVEPPVADRSTWSIMFEPREQPVRIDSGQLEAMSSDLGTLARWCAFLHAKAEAFSNELDR